MQPERMQPGEQGGVFFRSTRIMLPLLWAGCAVCLLLKFVLPHERVIHMCLCLCVYLCIGLHSVSGHLGPPRRLCQRNEIWMQRFPWPKPGLIGKEEEMASEMAVYRGRRMLCSAGAAVLQFVVFRRRRVLLACGTDKLVTSSPLPPLTYMFHLHPIQWFVHSCNCTLPEGKHTKRNKSVMILAHTLTYKHKRKRKSFSHFPSGRASHYRRPMLIFM